MSIPTAQNFLKGDINNEPWTGDMEEAMVEFAKLHVKAALEAAEEAASWSDLNTSRLYEILNSYPLENIK